MAPMLRLDGVRWRPEGVEVGMRLSWLWPWRHAGPQREQVHVVLYTRQGCHLCEHAEEVLQKARQRYGFRMEAVDVDKDADLAARHGQCVPVVTVNGKVRFRGGVNAVLLARLLRAEGRTR